METAHGGQPPADSVAFALQFSRYLQRVFGADAALRAETADRLQTPFARSEMEAFLEAGAPHDDAALKRALRRLRQRVMARLIVRDLAGLADLGEVVATATALAEVALGAAVGHHANALRERYGTPVGAESGRPLSLIVVGMGKLGGDELNVSSDIDLIFVYPEEGETDGERRISNHEFFLTLGRRLIGAISEITEDGQVFRVDMRLRPDGESGPLAASFAMLEAYFVAQAREWERFAWLKARPLTGERWNELDQLVRPFVYRKYLDFGAFASMRAVHAQIRQEVRRRESVDNIKLGPGGIREVEFIAQVFQLIRGGRVPELRVRGTRSALGRLASRGQLPPEAAAELDAAYVFLRRLEHRLQYLDDKQTQTLPQDEEDRARVARAMGFDDWDAFLAQLTVYREQVTRHFDAVFAAPEAEAGRHPLTALWLECGEACEERLGELGYRHPGALAERLRQLRGSTRYRTLPEASQRRFDQLVPRMLEAATAQAAPDETLERLLGLLETIGRRSAYLALLEQYPQCLESLARFMGASRWASEYLTARPILLDELLDVRVLYGPPDWSQLAESLRSQLEGANGDTEAQMDIMRHFRQAQTFRLIAQDLAGMLPIETLSDHLSALADLLLAETLRVCWPSVRGRHREQPRFAVVGYGKLGGKELGYATDLDIIFVYDDPSPEAPEVYARLAQRINTWLTSYTPAGVLYETDLRLRPDGASGLMVSSLEAFSEYQHQKAWVWEHQALTRARFCAGDGGVGAAFEAVRVDLLRQSRDPAKLREEVLAMRRKMLDAHPNPSELFDLKHDPGGIIDVEFAVQYLVLAHAHAHAALTGNVGNLALLRMAAELGLVDAGVADSARDAYRQYRAWQHQLRLQGAQFARVPADEAAEHAAAVRALWKSVLG